MNNMVGSLQNIKNDINRKRIFRSKSFALPADLPKTNIKAAIKDLSKNINVEKAELQKYVESKSKDIQRYTTHVRQLKKDKENYMSRLEKFDDKEVEKNITQYFDKILSSLPIEHIEFKEPAVTIFTTSIFKKHNKIMGAYRIWIDWNFKQHGDAIRVLNVHHESGNNPHPCVGSGGRICEGNATPTFKKYYEEKDIYNLLESIIGFILSENIRNGYITSWNRFFEQLRDIDPNTIFSRRGISPRRI